MMIHATPITLTGLPTCSAASSSASSLGLSQSAQAASHQFWYWHGASGRKYIHSVYEPEHCPPLPGAIYLAVKLCGANREVLAIGRFPKFPNYHAASRAWADLKVEGADEIHVHLLAKSNDVAEDIIRDLKAACWSAEHEQQSQDENRKAEAGEPSQAEKTGNVFN